MAPPTQETLTCLTSVSSEPVATKIWQKSGDQIGVVPYGRAKHFNTLVASVADLSSLAPELETLFLMPNEEHVFVSSRIAREVATAYGLQLRRPTVRERATDATPAAKPLPDAGERRDAPAPADKGSKSIMDLLK